MNYDFGMHPVQAIENWGLSQGSGEEEEPGSGVVRVVLEGWGCCGGVTGCEEDTSGPAAGN